MPRNYVEPATPDNFEEEGYLAANPDVRAAIADGRLASGRSHFDGVGHDEGRSLWLRDAILPAKMMKSERIRTHLIDPSAIRRVLPDGLIDCLPEELAAAAGVRTTEAVSSNEYDPWILEYIDSHPDAWILDAGSGLRKTYYETVVNLEIVPYDTTDVLGVGEKLPFKDRAFDLVVSVAVLEHVRDPFKCASELYRVLKPGGQLFVAVPFLQPYHGYPDHYYNMTSAGVRNLFQRPLIDVEQYVPQYFAPVWVAQWLFRLWAAGLPEASRLQLSQVTVAEFLDAEVDDYVKPWCRDLHPATATLIASGTVLRARRPPEENV